MAQTYDDSSIDLLIGAERIRRRPASMLGSVGLEGAQHGFTEIYGNALDEKSSGYGDKLDVKYYEDGSMSIRDYGRGVPLGWNEKRNNWNWHIIYNELYGGGKFSNGQWFLQSIDNWSEWSITNKEVRKSLKDEFNIDVDLLPDDGQAYSYSDLDVKRDGDMLYLHVNNISWSMASWQLLNKRLNYLASVGLNGLGAASTQYTSRFFDVISYRGGKATKVHFEHGVPVINGNKVNMFDGSYDITSYVPDETDTDEPDGTFIHWAPDSAVFSDVNITGDWLFDVCKDIAHIGHVQLHFENEKTGTNTVIEAGDTSSLLVDKYPDNLICSEDGDPIIMTCSDFGHGRVTVEGNPFIWVCKADVSIGFAKDHGETSCYHNSVRMTGGAQYDGVNIAVSKFFNEIANKHGVKFDSNDYSNIFSVVVSSYSNFASFRNQTKDSLDDSFIMTLIANMVYKKLSIEYSKGNKELISAIDRVVEEANARIAAHLAYKLKKETDKIARVKDPEKFHTCKAYMKKEYSTTELWITEGDSAQGAVDKARNSDFQATFPIRGKCLNVLKASLDKIMQNEEIRGIFSLLGTGMDIGGKDVQLFDKGKLKFDKIIFATDADEDGFQIRVLLFLVFYKLAPQLITDGHVYIAETPRFEIKLTDGNVIYAKDDEQRDSIVADNSGKVLGISRFKGLGEVNPDVLRRTTVHPDSRNLVQLTMDMLDENSRELIDALFGNDKFHQRKQILTTVLGADVASSMSENALLVDEIDNSDIDEGIEYTVV